MTHGAPCSFPCHAKGRRVFVAGAVALLAGLMPLTAAAQGADWPTKPMRLIVPYPAGGFSDAVARLLVPGLLNAWGQPVVVDNRAGANGVVGTSAAALAAPDGYTLLVAIDSHVSNHNMTRSLPYDAIKSFSPIALIGSAPMVLIANPALPANDVPQLVALAKAKPESLNYASLGPGSQIHLAARLLETATGIRMVNVPYKGGGPAFTDLLGGHIQLMFASATSATPMIRGGKVKALAVASPKRLPTLPDVPTMAEAGYPSVEMGVWLGFMAPAGTPEPIIAKVRNTLNDVVAQPEVAKRLSDLGVQLNLKGPAEFGAFVDSEITRWGDMLRRENIQPTD